MKKLFVLLLLMFSTSEFMISYAMPALDAGSINATNVMDLRLHEAITRSKEKNKAVRKETAEEQEQALKEYNQAALSDIKYVTFTNNNSISSKELYNVIRQYINQPMNPVNVSAVQKEIMRYYQRKGFYSVLATVTAENTQTGELILDVKEGGRNSITIESSY